MYAERNERPAPNFQVYKHNAPAQKAPQKAPLSLYNTVNSAMPPQTTLSRYGGWLPKSPQVYRAFLQETLEHARRKKQTNAAHEPAVSAFEKAILSDPIMKPLFKKIFMQVSPEYDISNFEDLLGMMDSVIVSAPKFQDAVGGGEPIGVPMYILFDLLGNTGAGYDLFRMPAFNVAMKDLLDAWGEYLTTEASNSTLTDEKEGWFGKAGLQSLEKDRGVFNETYIIPNPDVVNRGFTSWDNFFIREVQPQARPVDAADNKSLIHNACESTVFRIAHKVKAHDQFWLKGQPYSLYDMFDIGSERESYVKQFVGGTVYQAFLSPQDYHRWRSPIDGTIEKAVVIPGTYYATLPDGGTESDGPELSVGDPRGALIRSQAWLTMNAARALVFIQADNPVIGLLCFIAVGMVEVSTCSLSVQDGDKVKTGDELGMFHFGGSTHTLIFGPRVNVEFFDNVVVNHHLKVNSIIAGVSPAKSAT